MKCIQLLAVSILAGLTISGHPHEGVLGYAITTFVDEIRPRGIYDGFAVSR
jgi:hypothetical protein